MASVIVSILLEEKWTSFRMGCPVENCIHQEVKIIWKCMTNGCNNPLYIGNKGNIRCIPRASSVQHTGFITRLKFHCDCPDHKELKSPVINEICTILAKTGEFDIPAINPLSRKQFVASLQLVVKPHLERQGHEFLERKSCLFAIDEDLLGDIEMQDTLSRHNLQKSEAENWVEFKSGCPVENCYRVNNEMKWKCMIKNKKKHCRSNLYINNFGNVKCENSEHTGAIWNWIFYCDMHDASPVNLQNVADVLSNSKVIQGKTKYKSNFLYTLRSKIRKEIERRKSKHYKKDGIEKNTLLAMDEESEKEYPYGWGHKRDPPPLFTADGISDEASLTFDTVFVGAENILSRVLLKDSEINMDILRRNTRNALKMKRDIKQHERIIPKQSATNWNLEGHYNMFEVFSQMMALYEAIESKDYMKMLTIFYQSQHTHVLRYTTERKDIGIILDTSDVISEMWKEALTDAIESINEAAPGIYLFITNNFEEAKIEILESMKEPDRCFTDIETEIAKIYLGRKWPTDQLPGTAVHELLHALGFMHQMQRYDAHLHLFIKDSPDNKHMHQYETKYYAMLTRFDPFSVMMYPEHEYLSRKGNDPIWNLKPDKGQRQTMSELDKVALNFVYPPCITNLFNPRLNPTYQMLYCGRNVMIRPNQSSQSYTDAHCGPENWANCPACRVVKEIEIEEGGKRVRIGKIYTCIGKGKWQGMSGVFYCGKKHSKGKKAVCGPDEGLPCTDCGKMLYEGYNYEFFKRAKICTIL